MTKTLIAHVGAHKTATSLVQKYFKAKSGYYEARGLKFLTREKVSPYISWGEKIVKKGDAFNAFLHEEAGKTKAGTLLVSNENVLGKPFPRRKGPYPRHARILGGLKEATRGFNTKIVYGIRPQADFLQSYYLQRVHQGAFMTFNQFLEEIDLDEISWRPIVQAMHETFGEQNVVILDFNRIKQGQMAFIQYMLDRTLGEGIAVDRDYEEVHNASISDRGLQMALRINPLLRDGETGTVRRFLQAHFSNLTEPRPLLMSEELKAQLNARYGQEYEELITR